MAMPALPLSTRKIWTIADLERLPDDGNRYEILHGELLVTPMPNTRHQGAASRLLVAVANWCRANNGWKFFAPGGVHISETSWLEPDVAVYPVPEYDERDWRELPPPQLVIEVLSKSTARRDRFQKRNAYLANGVAAVWVVDAKARVIECWTSASDFPETYRDSIQWVPDEKLPALIISFDELFGPR